MRLRFAFHIVSLGLLIVAFAGPATGYGKKDDGAEAQIKQVFADFQVALKKRDGGKLWDLIAEQSRQDADRKAKAVRQDYAKASDKDRTETEKNLELSAGELRDLDGKGYLKSKRFFGLYHEVPDSKLEKITVTGERAKLIYKEEDGDLEKFALVKEKGDWKLIVPMPK